MLVLVWGALAWCSYRHVVGDLVGQWRLNASYSHGPIVLPIAIWLLWMRRSSMPSVQKPWLGALALLVAAHCLLWLGGYFYLPALERWSLPLALSAMIGLLAGRPMLRWSLPGVCFLAFMIPLPFQLEMLATQCLQSASAWGGCYLLGLTQTFAITDGYTVTTASGGVGITKDCSGLRMTVAVAALGYVITVLSQRVRGRERAPGRARGRWQSVGHAAVEFGTVMLAVVPVAIVANAARIAIVAWVADRYQDDATTGWTHEIVDWLVLPFCAMLFFALRAWIASAAEMLRTLGSPSTAWRQWGKVGFRLAGVPAVLAGMALLTIGHHAALRDRLANQTLSAARDHESNADWDQAASCYGRLLTLQPWRVEPRYRYAWVLLQDAETADERMRAFDQLAAVLNQSPGHLPALRSHLELALDFDLADPALRSAARLSAAAPTDVAAQRLCMEAELRFSAVADSEWSLQRFNRSMEHLGPATDWRDRLAMAIAQYCCDHPDSIDRRRASEFAPAITRAAGQIDTAPAYFQAWRFAHLFGTDAPSIELARSRIDGDCPPHVAYRIYLASARDAGLENRGDDVKRLLWKAIEQRPEDHAAYVILGDVYASGAQRSQRQWPQATAAYLRAWRLAGNRPLDLGVKLAEALLQSDRHQESAHLVAQLVADDNHAFHAASRPLRIRLMLVQARLDLHAGRHDDALATIQRCQTLVAMHASSSAKSARRRQTLQSLQLQCLVRLGRYGDAARVFESRAAESAHMAESDRAADQWTAAARAWRSDGNRPAAEDCYRSAVAAAGRDGQLWLEFVSLLHDRYGPGGAIEEIRWRQQRHGQTAPPADQLLAQAWEMVGRSDQAIGHYRSAAEQDVQDVAALAIALARHGRAEEAVTLVAAPGWAVDASLRAHTAAVVGVSAVELSPSLAARLEPIIRGGQSRAIGDTTLLTAIVDWYTRRQRPAAAMELLDRAVTADPQNVIAANNLAMLLADQAGDGPRTQPRSRALKLIDHVLEQTGPQPAFLDTKGWILVQMDRADEALPLLKQAADASDPTDPITHLHLATAYLAVGNRDRANDSFNVARSGAIRQNQLNHSERQAWTQLQNTLMQPTEMTAQAPGDRSAS
ncbi:archaeosortase/exosortase family protein [Rhodopirellula sp. JC639]|uniref:archaeosortase/exosortase family protein n=1 Tax=Stieleria mannarensis TaxID=2755585 RepID=UPI0016030A94